MTVSLITHTASLLTKPVGSSLINAITGKIIMTAGKGQEGRILSLLAAPVILKAITGKWVTRSSRETIYNMHYINKNF